MTNKQVFSAHVKTLKEHVWNDEDLLEKINVLLGYMNTTLKKNHQEKLKLFELYLPLLTYMSVTGML